jgi:hypothetical protein
VKVIESGLNGLGQPFWPDVVIVAVPEMPGTRTPIVLELEEIDIHGGGEALLKPAT